MNCTCTESSGFIEYENSESTGGQRSLGWDDPTLLCYPIPIHKKKEIKKQKPVSHIS